MRSKAKQREMRALRAAGLTLAGAERLTQTRGGSTLALSVLGGLGIVVLAGVGVLSMNFPANEEVAARDPVLATPAVEAEAEEEVIVAMTAPTPTQVVADAVETAAQMPMPDASDALPWIVALEQDAARVQQANEIAPVVAEVDCVVSLASDISGVLMQFDAGSALVPPTSYDQLFKVGAQVNACPQARILVAGHSDSSGSDLANLQLSWTRAENTVEALSALGVDTSQFETVGFGSRAPLEQGSDSDDGINRRVELRVLKGESQ